MTTQNIRTYPKYFMNPSTGSVDTLDGWDSTDGLIEVVSDGTGGWVEADFNGDLE